MGVACESVDECPTRWLDASRTTVEIVTAAAGKGRARKGRTMPEIARFATAPHRGCCRRARRTRVRAGLRRSLLAGHPYTHARLDSDGTSGTEAR